MTFACIVRRTSPNGTPCGEPVHIEGGIRQTLSDEQITALQSAGYSVQVRAGIDSAPPFAEPFLATYGVVSPHAESF